MRRSASWLLLAAVALVARAARADESCVTCHPDVRTEYDAGVHAKQFRCTECHGGDAGIVTTEAHAANRGYIGKPERAAIPKLCGTCHADVERMRASGLPTSQYAQYQVSRHGVLVAQGDTRAAVCTDCHGVHRIIGAAEPTSPVFRRNVVATCARCHSNAALMGSYHVSADAEEQFRGSVHGAALFVDEHPSAPTCATCHGAHSTHGGDAANGDTAAAACGKCHSRTREYFRASPHGAAVAAGKMAECTSCHAYHATARPEHALFDTACPTCHAADTPAARTGAALKTLLSQASADLDAAADDIARAQKHFPTVARHSAHLQQGRAQLLEALPVQHSLATQRIDDLTRGARSVADDVRSAVHSVESTRQVRLLILAVAWVFIVVTAGGALLYRRELQRRRRDGTGPTAPPVP